MKIAIASLLSFITFLSVVSQAYNCCEYNLSSSQNRSTISSAQEQDSTFQLEDSGQDSKKDSSCHQSGSTCFNCHLGHCAFTLDNSIIFATFNPRKNLALTTLSIVIFDFQTSPFRPPIA